MTRRNDFKLSGIAACDPNRLKLSDPSDAAGVLSAYDMDIEEFGLRLYCLECSYAGGQTLHGSC